MSLILNIDTSTEEGSICLASNGKSIGLFTNPDQKDHAAWIHPAIEKILQQTNNTIHDLKAVAVTAGPGSYTGLRVAMATAKGLCYALDIPLIIENTLRVMALASIQACDGQFKGENILFCPMIDARRMEVFTALFNSSLEELMDSTAMILDRDSFSKYLSGSQVIFSGNGARKFQQLASHPHAIFSEVTLSGIQLAELSDKKFTNQDFADVAYAEPVYLKEFYTIAKK